MQVSERRSIALSVAASEKEDALSGGMRYLLWSIEVRHGACAVTTPIQRNLPGKVKQTPSSQSLTRFVAQLYKFLRPLG